MKKFMMISGALIVLLPVVANAQKGALKRACGADIKQYCAGVKRGGGRVTACAKEHFGDFSGPCRSALITTARVVIRACKGDAKDKCAAVREPAEIAACFQEHFAELSAPCKDVLLPAAQFRGQ
jgi:Cysteine rich repeat